MNNQATLPDLPGEPTKADAARLHDFLTRHISPHIHLMHSGPGFPGRWFGADVDGAVRWACDANNASLDCYLTPAQTVPGTNKKPSKADIVAATRAHADLDPAENWNQTDTIEQLKRDGASLIVDSGRGVWGYWTLAESVSDQPAIEAVNTAIRDHYRAMQLGSPDAAQNIDRAARLPYTINWKTGRLSTVVHEVDTRHTLDGLRTRFPVAPTTSATAFDFSKPLPDHYRFSGMTDAERIADICADPKLAALWNGDVSAHPDRSDADFALACAVIERARNPERAVELFERSGLAPSKRPADANRKDGRYVARTINKAMARLWQSEPQYLFRDAVFSGSLPRGAYVTQLPTSTPAPAVAATTMPDLVAASSFAGRDVPVRQWIVAPLIPQGYVTDLTADGGTGKSLLALQLGVARATGMNWLGMPAKSGPTIYLAAEDDIDELHRRLVDICRETGTSLDALDDLHILPLFGSDARLAGLTGKDFQPTALYAHLHTLISRVQAGLIIIDTRADTFGGDEVNRAQVMQFVSMLKKVANDHSATVLLISHPSRSGQSIGDGQSGSTAWGNAVRSRLYLTREPTTNLLTLVTKKANYGPNDTEIKLEWRRGCFVSLGSTADPFYRAEIEGKAQGRFLELLQECYLAGTNVSAHLTSVNGAPAVFSKMDKTISKDHYRDAMRRLMQTGKVVLEEYRYDGKDKQRLKIA